MAGFIGSKVADHFVRKGFRVIGIDRVSPGYVPVTNLAAYHCIELPDPSLGFVLQDHMPDLCIHCAGPSSVGFSIANPSMDFYKSTVLTFELLEALRRACPECGLIFLSSAAVYGNPESLPVNETYRVGPISPYGFHKLQCELLCQEYALVYGLRTVSLRIFSAYGEGLRRQVVWDICRKAMKDRHLVLQGTGRESRDFVHVRDVVRAIELISSTAAMKGEAYNVGSGKETSIAELANLILNELGSRKVPRFDGIVPSGTPTNWCADISRLRELGYTPSVPLEQGVKDFVNWFLRDSSAL